MIRVALILTLGTSLIFIPAVSASDTPELVAGQVIRVSVLEEAGQPSQGHTIRGTVRGALLSMSPARIELERLPSGEQVFIPRDRIARIEISVRSSRKPVGAVIGVGLGALCGAVIGATTGNDREDPQDEALSWHGGQEALLFGAIFGAAGGVIGALVAPGERWWVLPPERWQMALGPGEAGGGMLALRCRF